MEENWKEILGYEDIYEVSNLGRIRSFSRTVFARNGHNRRQKGQMLKIREKEAGYFYVGLVKGKKQKNYHIHRLVATHFIENPFNKPHVNHLDGNKANNAVSNLEWCTPQENIDHSIKNGFQVLVGENNPSAKLTRNQVEEIRIKYQTLKLSYGKLAKEYGLSDTHVYRIVKGVNWK